MPMIYQFEFQPVRKEIMATPPNKTPGFDKVLMSVVKDCPQHITNIINSSFANFSFSRAWKRGKVVHYLKDGDHEVPNKNRPISLLQILPKVAEKIPFCQFNNYLKETNRLTFHESGNREFHSTETFSLMLTDHTLQAMDRKHITAVVLIDLRKAFDILCHLILLNKLTRLGTLNKALLWFQSYLTNRQQCIGIATSLSEPLTLGTFSIRFFMWNGKPQTAKRHVTTALRSRLQFAVHVWTAGRASSGKWFTARFFATKNCTASRLKVWTSFL